VGRNSNSMGYGQAIPVSKFKLRHYVRFTCSNASVAIKPALRKRRKHYVGSLLGMVFGISAFDRCPDTISTFETGM
jgi:hypothetical protein